MEHIDKANWVSQALRDLVVIGDYLVELTFAEEVLDDAQVHLTLLNLTLEASSRIHALCLFLVDVWLVLVIKSHALLLCAVKQIIKSATEFYRGSKLFDESVTAL